MLLSFQFISGMITKDAIADLDFILATPDNMNALTTLRSTLRERLPKLGNDTIHLDVRYMLEKYTKGVIYDIKKPSEETGKAQIPFGKVNMSHVMRKVEFAYAKTKAPLFFATQIVQFLLYLYPNFQASSLLLSLHRPVCVRPGQKSRRPHMSLKLVGLG